MPYRIAGIDVHKKMLAVVVADVEVDGEFDFDRQKAGTTPTDLRHLADLVPPFFSARDRVCSRCRSRSWPQRIAPDLVSTGAPTPLPVTAPVHVA